MTSQTLKIISTFSGLLPVIAGLLVFKKAGRSIRLFCFFLLYGALTDMAVWYLMAENAIFLAKSIFYVYAPIEGIVFCLLVSNWTSNSKIKIASKISIGLWIILWLFFHLDFNKLTWYEEPNYGLFVSMYEMVISWLAGASILFMTRQENNIYNRSSFWILTGIFFYCFCTFSVTTLVLTKALSDKVWFFHNSINILTSFIYTYGFLRNELRRNEEPEFKLD